MINEDPLKIYNEVIDIATGKEDGTSDGAKRVGSQENKAVHMIT